MKKAIICTLLSTIFFSNNALAKTSLWKIDNLEYLPHQVMTDAEMANTKGKAIPVVLVPLLWGAAQGMAISLSSYAAMLAISGKDFNTTDAVIAAASGAFSGGVSGATTVTKFMLMESGGLFFGGLAGEGALGQNKHKIGPPLDAVPTQAELNTILNNPNWAKEHLKNMPGMPPSKMDDIFRKAIDDPSSWKKVMRSSCVQCH